MREIAAEGLCISFIHEKKLYPAVCGLDLEIQAGEMVALIGESGCGKSVTALTMMGLEPPHTEISGKLYFREETDLLKLTKEQWQSLRGNEIAMIFQEPMTALNPVMKIGKQVQECLQLHEKCSRREAKQRVLEQLRLVGLPDVEYLYHCYPHQLSGGQRQRVMIAMAFINRPALLVADEPTTALDVTVQAQIMKLMKEMNEKTKSAVLLISHDLGVVRQLCSRAYIMYAGYVVESGPVADLLEQPLHPYTKGLAEAIPDVGKKGQRLTAIPGTVPGLYARTQKGCPFANRCPEAKERCFEELPQLQEKGTRRVRCHRYE